MKPTCLAYLIISWPMLCLLQSQVGLMQKSDFVYIVIKLQEAKNKLNILEGCHHIKIKHLNFGEDIG